MGVSIFMIVLNEEGRIGRALDSVEWADEIVVVDGGSHDRTVEICKQKGARVFMRPFDNFAAQKNHAISLTSQEWVFGLDADESVSENLATQVRSVSQPSAPINGYLIPRRNKFLGKHLRFGGQGTEWILRLFRKDAGTYRGIVHEVVDLSGDVGRISGVLDHESTESIDEYFRKLPIYTGLEARRLVEEQRVPNIFVALIFPPLIWVRDYLLLGGFLDGRAGCMYHALSCYYRWIKNFRARSRQFEPQAVSA